MIKTHEAIDATIEAVKAILAGASLLDGLSLTPEQIKSTTTPIFWFINTKSKDASEKETYVTYYISGLPPIQYGDGVPVVRKASVIVEIFTRRMRVTQLTEDLNNAFLNVGWTFELQSMNYDNGNQMYVHTFLCEGQVME